MTAENVDASREPGDEADSIWLATTPGTDYGPLAGDLEVDTAVVGGGIAGLSTAYELVDAGQTVAILERGRIVAGTTGRTTAKLTSQHGLVYADLVESFGVERARQYAEANEAAIDEVESRAEAVDADCDFERAPAYAYTESADGRAAVEEEVEAARRLGLPASAADPDTLPVDAEAAVRFDDQAHFHPRKYLLSLAREIAGGGDHLADGEGQVFERTRVTDVEDGEPCTVTTDRGEVVADDVVLATHFPIVDPALYFARLVPKRSYVLAVRLGGEAPDGMFYRTGDPYFSVRPHPAGESSMALVGGENHRTGHGGGTADRYGKLEREARDRLEVEAVEYRWSTQDYASVDRVPLVGALAPQVEHVHVATGFGGWGLTNGTAAGRILADRILGRENPRSGVYRPTRFEFAASKDALLDHNRHSMTRFLSDTLGGAPAGAIEDVGRGEGRVVEVAGDPVAVHRDGDGALHAVSAVCPHMGCLVEWNDAERSWDCPCHGSRFDADGTVLDTPAVDGLESYDVVDRPGRGGE